MKQLKIRFNGFRDEWVEKKLNDVLIDSNEKSSKDNEFDVLSSTVKDIELRHGRTSSSSSMGYKILDIGQLVLSPQNIWMGNINVNFYKKGLVSPSYKVYNFYTDLLIPEYARIVVKQPNMIYQYNNASVQGASIVRKNLDLNSFNNISIQLPSLPEQQKIGALFSKYDAIISLREQKLAELKALKKGMLQQMFPKNGVKVPELRFEGFADDWVERKWIDTVDMSTNMVNPKTGDYDDLWHIGPGNIESFTGRLLDNVNTVKHDNLISGKFHFYPNDIIYGKINPQLAKYIHVDFEGLASADAYVLNSKNGVNQVFLFVELQTFGFYKYSVSVSMRTGMPKINRTELNHFSYLAPKDFDEQQKIGQLFKHLDARISNEQSKIEQLKAQKQGLLQKMIS